MPLDVVHAAGQLEAVVEIILGTHFDAINGVRVEGLRRAVIRSDLRRCAKLRRVVLELEQRAFL